MSILHRIEQFSNLLMTSIKPNAVALSLTGLISNVFVWVQL